jgi:DNA invertase Pin-like site-specific DNA recombinase
MEAEINSNTYGYCRVSSKTQGEALIQQEQILIQNGVPASFIYRDVGSGPHFQRKEFEELRKQLKAGDHVICPNVEKFGRNLLDSLNLFNEFEKQNIKVTFLDLDEINLPTVSGIRYTVEPSAKLKLNILLGFAQFQNERRQQLQKLGIQRIKENPELRKQKYKGRKTKLNDQMIQNINHFRTSGLRVGESVKALNISIRTYYRFLEKMKNLGILKSTTRKNYQEINEII